MAFTFKRTTQRWDRLESYEIKHKRQFVGQMFHQFMGTDFKIMFRIVKNDINEDGNPNCKWRWMTLKTPQFQNIDEVKTWINTNELGILKLNIFLENE